MEEPAEAAGGLLQQRCGILAVYAVLHFLLMFRPLALCLCTLQAKASLRMGLEDITDTTGPLGGLKWIGFFGASFFPSLFLAGYFLGGYYPGLAVGAAQEPDWWPTSMQVIFYSSTPTVPLCVRYLPASPHSSPLT